AKTSLSLDEVLDFCRGRMAVNVELKSDKDEARARETGAAVAARLAARGRGDFYISSFWWSALESARSTAPTVRRAFLFSDSPDRAALLASAKAQGLWALHPERMYVTQELIKAAHAASLRVNTWTVNDAKEIATFRNWSVDGIMSDFPERVPKD
ncbi:MAG: glycerophosphodiester phosphodiesterase, partial [Chloroflexota bacterium]|nr:glycerophosphodiester phosphodiesterase [Chloroflexota bacterium]